MRAKTKRLQNVYWATICQSVAFPVFEIRRRYSHHTNKHLKWLLVSHTKYTFSQITEPNLSWRRRNVYKSWSNLIRIQSKWGLCLNRSSSLFGWVHSKKKTFAEQRIHFVHVLSLPNKYKQARRRLNVESLVREFF